MSNKKGQGLSLNFIIIAALAVIALIIIALFFTGGISRIFKKETDIVKATEQELALSKTNCDFWCSTGIKDSFIKPPFSESVKAAGYVHCGKFPDYGNTGAESAWTENCASGTCSGSPDCSTKSNKKTCTATSGCTWK